MSRIRCAAYLRTIALVICVLVGITACTQQNGALSRITVPVTAEARIAQAFERRESNLWVEAGGVVERIFPDDEEGVRHQRFIVRLSSGQTLLIAHNIDIAPRVHGIRVGDDITFFGKYEYNEKGGVIHWTHHDPGRRHAGGWIEHGSRLYR